MCLGQMQTFHFFCREGKLPQVDINWVVTARWQKYSIGLPWTELVLVNRHETSLSSQEKVFYSIAATCPRAILDSAIGKMVNQKMIHDASCH